MSGEEHGVQAAYYSGGPTEPYFQPCIHCICGWSSGRGYSWAFVGEAFDEHLAEVEKAAASGVRQE